MVSILKTQKQKLIASLKLISSFHATQNISSTEALNRYLNEEGTYEDVVKATQREKPLWKRIINFILVID